MLGVLPYANRTDSTSKSKDVARSGIIHGLVGLFGLLTTLCAVYLEWLTTIQSIQLWGLVILISCILGWRFMKQVNGLTGDFLGATQRITELAVLCVVLI